MSRALKDFMAKYVDMTGRNANDMPYRLAAWIRAGNPGRACRVAPKLHIIPKLRVACGSINSRQIDGWPAPRTGARASDAGAQGGCFCPRFSCLPQAVTIPIFDESPP